MAISVNKLKKYICDNYFKKLNSRTTHHSKMVNGTLSLLKLYAFKHGLAF